MIKQEYFDYVLANNLSDLKEAVNAFIEERGCVWCCIGGPFKANFGWAQALTAREGANKQFD